MEFTNFEKLYNEDELQRLEETLNEDLTEQDEKQIALFESLYSEGKITDEEIMDWLQDPTNEGVLGSIIGGLSGFALGKKMGKIIAKVLGIEKGVLYDLLTSRIFGAALGSAIGKQF